MQLRIVHVTGFEYDGEVSASYNEARMTPQTSAHQTVSHTRLEVTPHPWTQAYRDYWGTIVTGFEVLAPHGSLTVTATCMVQTEGPRPASGTPLTWAELLDGPTAENLCEYLTVTDRVRPPADLVEQTRALVASGGGPSEVAREVCGLVRKAVDYVPGSTDVHDEAATAWSQGSGVCQDIVHLVVGALRSIGLPARYVSGYLLPSTDPVVGEAVHGESHAWVEWWDGSWTAYDPTNDEQPGERHVIVATGRDYADVRPLSGIYTGAGTSRMFVNVQITRLS
ncbi:MAG TPA: transglutaminase family protein [Nocardioides sp.]|nr:transglutaminase family protein [Nocardioides sp.]